MDCLAKEAFPYGGEKTVLEMEGGDGGDGLVRLMEWRLGDLGC
jgi:hypothetical protein